MIRIAGEIDRSNADYRSPWVGELHGYLVHIRKHNDSWCTCGSCPAASGPRGVYGSARSRKGQRSRGNGSRSGSGAATNVTRSQPGPGLLGVSALAKSAKLGSRGQSRAILASKAPSKTPRHWATIGTWIPNGRCQKRLATRDRSWHLGFEDQARHQPWKHSRRGTGRRRGLHHGSRFDSVRLVAAPRPA